MRKILLFILFMTCIPAFAQTHSSADKAFQAGNYEEAQQAYAALLKSYPREALYLYRYARCAQELGDLNTAITYFGKAGDRYMLKYFYLGDIYMQLWQPEKAIEAYNTYLKSQKQPNEREGYIQQQIATAEKLQRYMRRVERIQVLDSVQVSLDSLLYACPLSSEAGSLATDERGQIVYTNQRKDRRLWGDEQDSSAIILTNHSLLDDWTTPDTLPTTINFTTHQSAPYLLSDGITLYFAAQDINGFGGLDIYVSRYNAANENYTIPENIGLPYNSTANEYLFALDEAKGVGYLATDRFAKEGYVHVYSFVIPEYKQYWKNLPADSLADYARLLCFERGELKVSDHTDHPAIEMDNAPEFRFIINDSVVYHSLKEFHNRIAVEKFLEWQQLEEKYQDEQDELNDLRLEYSTADEETQKELTPLILQLEKNQNKLLQRRQNLLNEIRRIEMSAH